MSRNQIPQHKYRVLQICFGIIFLKLTAMDISIMISVFLCDSKLVFMATSSNYWIYSTFHKDF